jgi:hypothetical protein
MKGIDDVVEADNCAVMVVHSLHAVGFDAK